MKYKIRIVLEREVEQEDNRTVRELKAIAEDIKPEIAVDFGVDESDIQSVTIKKVSNGKD